LRRLIIGLNVPLSVECEPDKSNRQQNGAGYDQPMWIFHLKWIIHLKHSQLSRRFWLLEYLRTTHSARRLPREGAVIDDANPTAVRRQARRLKWGTSKERATKSLSACYQADVPNLFLGIDASLRPQPSAPPAGAGSLKPRSPDQATNRPPNRAQITTTATIRTIAKIVRRPSGSFQNLIFERYTFRIVFLQPGFRRVLGRKDLEMIAVANLLAGVEVNPDRHC
jgi:hypothetical protein